MQINDSVLRRSERIIFELRELYLSRGYRHYRMSKFEEYDLYAGNKEFLLSENVITFTDAGGRLMALKPDVTLSIIKNSADEPRTTHKVFYNENVYRTGKGEDSFKEIMQAGVECFGLVGEEEIAETLTLAAESLGRLSERGVLAISDLGVMESIIGGLGLDSRGQKSLYAALGDKNFAEVERICTPIVASLLKELLSLPEDIEEALPVLRKLIGGTTLYNVLCSLAGSPFAPALRVDFSVTGDTNYYNGIIFKGFIPGIPDAVLSGGQYNRLMSRMGRKSSAIGFAVYTDLLEREEQSGAGSGEYLSIALPKGRLGEQVYALLEAAGYACPGVLDPGRKLIFENGEKKVRYFWVKPSDVAIYVSRGAADVGVVGKDILLEQEPDVYELLDLKMGKCRMTAAAPEGFRDSGKGPLRVATKFPHIARKYYRAQGRDIDVIKLNGSIEVAPILGLSDIIVDIVETGTTLKENRLAVISEIAPISARLISNKAGYKFKREAVDTLTTRMAEKVKNDDQNI